jgi:hypothetical protein
VKRIYVQFTSERGFKIVYQSNIGYDFGERGYFETRNFTLSSATMPQVETDRCYMRGDHDEYNFTTLFTYGGNWKTKFLDAVNRYNETYR